MPLLIRDATSTVLFLGNRLRALTLMPIGFFLKTLFLPFPLLKGSLLIRGTAPPSKYNGTLPRAFCPFVPLPAVLPRPEPCPIPIRRFFLSEILLSVFNFILQPSFYKCARLCAMPQALRIHCLLDFWFLIPLRRCSEFRQGILRFVPLLLR